MRDAEVDRLRGRGARWAEVGANGLAVEVVRRVAREADSGVRSGRIVRDVAVEAPFGLGPAASGEGLPGSVVSAPASTAGVQLMIEAVGDLVADGVLDLDVGERAGEVSRERDPLVGGSADAEASARTVEPEGPAARGE